MKSSFRLPGHRVGRWSMVKWACGHLLAKPVIYICLWDEINRIGHKNIIKMENTNCIENVQFETWDSIAAYNVYRLLGSSQCLIHVTFGPMHFYRSEFHRFGFLVSLNGAIKSEPDFYCDVRVLHSSLHRLCYVRLPKAVGAFFVEISFRHMRPQFVGYYDFRGQTLLFCVRSGDFDFSFFFFRCLSPSSSSIRFTPSGFNTHQVCLEWRPVRNSDFPRKQ